MHLVAALLDNANITFPFSNTKFWGVFSLNKNKKYLITVFGEKFTLFFLSLLPGYTFEYLIETLGDGSHKKFFNVPKLGGTKYGNVALYFLGLQFLVIIIICK